MSTLMALGEKLKCCLRLISADVRFAPGSQLLMLNEDTGKTMEVKVVSSREHKNMYIVKFAGL